jgi:hypothetical protein
LIYGGEMGSDRTEQGFNLSFHPVIDGKFITASPQQLVKEGKIVNVPFIASKCFFPVYDSRRLTLHLFPGDTDDEGT